MLVESNSSDTFPLASVVVVLYLSPTLTTVPNSTAVSIKFCLNSTVAILAFSMDFQSISFT